MTKKRTTPDTRLAIRIGLIGGFVCGLLVGWAWSIIAGGLVLLGLMFGLVVATVRDYPRTDATQPDVIADCIDRIWPKANNRDVKWEDRDRLDISLICCELVCYRQGWKSRPKDGAA